jgi:hypothetical protein
LAAAGEDDDDDDGGAPAAALLLLPVPLLPPPPAAAAEFGVARAEAARLPPSPPPDDDVAATMAAQGLAATGADGCSSGISRKKESRGRKEGIDWFFRSQVQTEERRKAFPLCAVSPFSASVSLKALCLCRKPVSF